MIAHLDAKVRLPAVGVPIEGDDPAGSTAITTYTKSLALLYLIVPEIVVELDEVAMVELAGSSVGVAASAGRTKPGTTNSAMSATKIAHARALLSGRSAAVKPRHH